MKPLARLIVIIAALFGFSSLALGAIGAHALGNPASWQSAVHTQTSHALLLLALVALHDKLHPRAFTLASVLVIVGAFLFSGSIYVKTLLEIENATKLAPYGGTMLMLAWLCVAAGALRRPLVP